MGANISCMQGGLVDAECIVCMEKPRTTLFIPCGHLVTCQSCAANKICSRPEPVCPICQQAVVSTLVPRL